MMRAASSGEVGSVVEGATDTRGKHRISADLKRFEQVTRFLEEELEQLERADKASEACKELLVSVQTRPDPSTPTNEWSYKPNLGKMVGRTTEFFRMLLPNTMMYGCSCF